MFSCLHSSKYFSRACVCRAFLNWTTSSVECLLQYTMLYNVAYIAPVVLPDSPQIEQGMSFIGPKLVLFMFVVCLLCMSSVFCNPITALRTLVHNNISRGRPYFFHGCFTLRTKFHFVPFNKF